MLEHLDKKDLESEDAQADVITKLLMGGKVECKKGFLQIVLFDKEGHAVVKGHKDDNSG